MADQRALGAYLSSAYASSPTGVALLGLDGQILAANPALSRMLRSDEQRLRELTLAQVVVRADDDVVVLPSASGTAGEAPVVMEAQLLRADGEVIAVRLSMDLVHHDGSPVGVVAHVEDLGARGGPEEVRATGTSDPRAPGDAWRGSGGLDRTLAEHALEAVVVFDASGRLTYASASSEQVFGWHPDQLIGIGHVDLVPQEERARLVRLWDDVISRPGSATQALHGLEEPDGSRRWMDTVVSNQLHNPAVKGLVLTSRDATDRVTSEQVLRASEQRYRSVVERVSDVVFSVDGRGHWSFLNAAWTEVTGLGVADSIGAPLLDFVHPEDRDDVAAALTPVLSDGGKLSLEARYVNVRGEQRWFEAHARASVAQDLVLWCSGVLRDVTHRRRSDERLTHLALHDALTDLPNRTLLVDRLHQALARATRNSTLVAVLFIDLDHFKAVNDRLGHDAGDAALVAVAERLQRVLRDSETLARFGGDEFVVVSEGLATPNAAGAVAERLQDALGSLFVVGGHELSLVASIGVATIEPGAESDPVAVIHQADAAMYRMKNERRHRGDR